MADNATLSNNEADFRAGTYPSIPTRAIEDVNGKLRQVIRVCFGIGTGESIVTTTNPLPVDLSAPTNSTSTGLEASRVVKASAGTLFTVSGYNTLSTTQYIHLFNLIAVPADSTVPALIIVAAGNSTFGYSGGIRGRAFSTGIVICNSTTPNTKTLGLANCLFDIQYK